MKLTILQARMASTRLPGKVMKTVLGKPLIGYQLERLRSCEKVDRILLATSTEISNDVLCAWAEKQGLPVYRGSENDVLDRFYQAGLAHKATTVLRVTADCPLIDPAIIDRLIDLYEKEKLDYAATASDRPGFPDGLDAEIFRFEALEEAWKSARLQSEREHVTPYLRKSASMKKAYLRPEADHSDERWTVDDEEDFRIVKGVLEHLYPKNPDFSMEDVLRLRSERPDIFRSERIAQRNEGYQKSLRDDFEKGLVSVAVAVYNGEKYLAEQLESLRAQTHRHLEILVVDDGSTDRSVEIAKALAAKDARIHVHRNAERLGVVNNFLSAAALAKGEYFCFCDQDDVWSAEKVRALKGMLTSAPSLALVYSDLEVCDESMQPTHRSFWRATGIRPRRGDLSRLALLKNIPPGCSMMMRADVRALLAQAFKDEDFRRLNAAARLDDTPFMHDHLAFTIASWLGGIDHSPGLLVRYRQHRGNNIGAFYAAEKESGHFARQLALKIEILRTVRCLKAVARTGEAERFLKSLEGAALPHRFSALPSYLYLRDGSAFQALLGTLQCLFPGWYAGLKQRRARCA